jgi:hypothetical protein
MRTLKTGLALALLWFGQLPIAAADPRLHEGPVTSMDDALNILGLSPLSCTPKKGFLSGLDYFVCLEAAGTALEGAFQSPGGLRGCLQNTGSEYWKALDGDRKKLHKTAVKAATKQLKMTSSTSTWELLRELTAGDVHFVNGCGASMLVSAHQSALQQMGFGDTPGAPCTALTGPSQPGASSRSSRAKKKPISSTPSSTSAEMLRQLQRQAEACQEASIMVSARFKATEYLLNPAHMDRGGTTADWWHIKELSPGVFSRQGGGSPELAGLPRELQAQLANLPASTRNMVIKKYRKRLAKQGRRPSTSSSSAGEALMKQYQGHSKAAAEQIKTHIEKLIKEVISYASGCQAVDAATFKPAGEGNELDYSPAYNASRDCAYLVKHLKQAGVPTASDLLTLPEEISAALNSDAAPGDSSSYVQMIPPLHGHFKAETRALVGNVTATLRGAQTAALLTVNQEDAVQRGQDLLLLCEEENISACLEKVAKDTTAYQLESQRGTCEELLPLWDGEIDPEVREPTGLAKALPQGKMPRSGKRKTDVVRQINRLKGKIALAEKQADRVKAQKERKQYLACMKRYSGRFLCDGSSKLFCGNRCGHHTMCRCCSYPQATRKRMCK